MDYLKLASNQDEFSNLLDSIRVEKMPHWGSFEYHVSIAGKDPNGDQRLFRFNVRQLFCESFCNVDGLDYSFYPRAQENAAKTNDLITCKRHYTSCVYDKVASFILSLPESPLVIFEHSNIENWSDIDGFHFDYLKDLLVENGIAFIDSSTLKNYVPNVNMPIVVVELISNNDKVIYNCEKIFKFGSGNSTVCYISLLKEYDREEMAFLIEQERSKQESQKKQSVFTSSIQQQFVLPKDYSNIHSEATKVKDNYIDYKNILEQNGIAYLYHFTDRRNLESIKKHGGLLSWFYCEKNNIKIPFPGGDSMSKALDRSFNLQDYVRLSFCEDHPMSWRLQQQGYDLVLLKIKVEAAWLRTAIYSDMNAADMCHTHGGALSDLERIDFTATKQHYVRRDSPIFKQHQAEVLIKTFLPIEYIVNFDNPDII